MIKGYVEILQKQNKDNSELTIYLNVIWSNAERIEKIPLSVAEKLWSKKARPFASD